MCPQKRGDMRHRAAEEELTVRRGRFPHWGVRLPEGLENAVFPSLLDLRSLLPEQLAGLSFRELPRGKSPLGLAAWAWLPDPGSFRESLTDVQHGRSPLCPPWWPAPRAAVGHSSLTDLHTLDLHKI